MLRTRLWLLSTITIAIISTTVLILSYNNNSIQSLARAQDNNSDLRKERTFVGGHTPGYGVIETSGGVLDPISLNFTIKDAVVDPMKYLREFNYGRISELPNGTRLREFTLVVSDDKVKEISSGVFYNVWTFNGTIPGPFSEYFYHRWICGWNDNNVCNRITCITI